MKCHANKRMYLTYMNDLTNHSTMNTCTYQPALKKSDLSSALEGPVWTRPDTPLPLPPSSNHYPEL